MAKGTALLIVLVCVAAVARAQVDTSIVPDAGRTTWAPGVRGGVPARATICATLQAASFGNGAQEASAAIQAAVAACPPGQVVRLSAGTFLVNNHILINKGITLRGAGPGRTRLVKTNGAKPFDYRPDDAQPIIIVGPSRWPQVNNTTSVNLTANAVKGSNSVTVTNAAGFAPGQFVLLDEDDFNTASWTPLPRRLGGQPSAVWASDRLVFQRHNPSESIDDPFPASLTWFSRAARPLCEIKEITAVSGNRIMFSTPVHITYTTSKRAQLTRYMDVHVRGAGIEDLTVSGGSNGNIRFEVAAYSWMKNVENTFWLGEGVSVDNSFRVEIRDSLIHDGSWPYPGGGGYAISLALAASEVLIENNAVTKANKMMVARSAGAGSVVGYNYMDDGYIGYDLDWVEVGLNGSHMVGGHHILFEGNQSFNYDSDNTHGNAIAMTVFRNHLTGSRRSFPGMANARGGGLMYGSWWHSFIGNVLGEDGRMSGWVYEDPGDGTFTTASYIWKFGYDPAHWEQVADPKAKSTALRDGNFDYLTNQLRWDRAPRTIPASLYLTTKPAFFGNRTWPWVDPAGGTKLSVLPARQRFDTSFSSLIPTLSATPNSIARGGSLTVTWRAIPRPSATDWIGLHRAGTPPTDHVGRMYVNCSQTAGAARASGSCVFPVSGGLASGTYELRLHAADGLNVWVTSNAVSIR
jgi:Pectate lyase superfamily protein